MKSIPHSATLSYLFKSNYNLFEAAASPIIAEDLLGKVIFVNKNVTDILGYKSQELIGNDINSLMPETEWKAVKKRRLETSSGRKGIYDKRKFVTHKGEIVEFSDEMHPIFGFDKETIGFMHHLTQHKQEDVGALYALLESCKDGIMLLNMDGNILDANEPAENLFSLKKEEITGKPIGHIIAERSISRYEEYWKRKISHPNDLAGEFDVELYCRKKNGKEFPVEVTFIPLGDTIVMADFRDMSEKKQMERSLRSSNIQLKRFKSELQQYTYITSHNLREPLHVISNYIELLQKKYADKLDAKALHFMGHIVNSSDKMNSLLKDLLDFSSIDVYTRLDETDCKTVVGEILAENDSLLKSNNVKVNIGELPVITANAVGMKKVFYHLVNNACKFQKEQPEAEVAIDARENKKDWIFSVTDNGVGIDEQECKKIFLLFQRLHATEKYSGNGVGLAIAKKIVEMHGGKIWVESELGEGTTFYFSLPKYIPQ
jgi:PAS domain S-box-containing protein